MLSKLLKSRVHENNKLEVDIVIMRKLSTNIENVHFIAKDNFNQYVSKPFNKDSFLKKFKSKKELLNYVLSLSQFVDIATINNIDLNNPEKGDLILKSNIDLSISGFDELQKEF